MYGRLGSGCDTTDCTAGVIAGELVGIFDAQPRDPVTGGLSRDPLVSTTTDGVGFYELDVAPGHYWVAWIARGTGGTLVIQTNVGELDVVGLERLDFSSGPGGGRWYPVD